MADLIPGLAAKYGVPEWVVRNMVRQESGGRHYNARGGLTTSSAGAFGIAQLMPGTARGLEQRYGIDTRTPAGNLEGGVAYLGEQLRRFGSIPLALSAYNSGPAGAEARGRVEGYPETQNYVRSIMGGHRGGGASGTLSAEKAAPPIPAFKSDTLNKRAIATALLAARRGGGDTSRNMVQALLNLKEEADSERMAPPQMPIAPPAAAFSRENADQGGLVPAFDQALGRLIEAVPGLSVSSGYRSPERQAVLFQDAVRRYGSEQAARKWVAPPGSSKHNQGIAADLGGNVGSLNPELLRRFGLWRPMAHEPWHVELIGSRG